MAVDPRHSAVEFVDASRPRKADSVQKPQTLGYLEESVIAICFLHPSGTGSGRST